MPTKCCNIGSGRSRGVGLLGALLAISTRLSANTINVDTLTDQFGQDLAHCSLREAVQSSNTASAFGGCATGDLSGNIIVLMPGRYTLDVAGAGDDSNATGDIDVTRDATIGPIATQPHTVIVDGLHLDRVFDVANKAQVTFRDMTIVNGNADLAALPAGERLGGGVRIRGSSIAQFSDLVLSGNSADGGGAVDVQDGSGMSAYRSAFVLNRASAQDGGAILLAITGSYLQINVATLSGNQANRDGGGIQADHGVVTLNNVRIIGNNAANPLFGGGGLDVHGSAVADITNSVLSDNLTGDLAHRDCAGSVQQFDTSLIRHSAGCSLPAAMNGSLIDIDPQLTVRGEFGGHTPVHHPRSTSPLIDAGSPALSGSIGSCVALDQRGKGWQGLCDIGAVQWNMDFSVTRNDDATDVAAGSGVCQAAGGGCTLRAAIQQANALGAAHPGNFYSIFLPPGEITLSIPGQGEVAAATGDLNINAPTNLFGHKDSSLSGINANQLDRVFDVHANAAFVDLGVRNGQVAGAGGGIAVNDAANVVLDHARVHDNAASGHGGGVYLGAGRLDANHCAIFNNAAANSGGGILQDTLNNSPPNALLLSNCTLASNHAGDRGGALAAWLDASNAASLNFVTIAQNYSTSFAAQATGGIDVIGQAAAQLTLNDSIVASNFTHGAQAIPDNCAGNVTLRGDDIVAFPAAACVMSGTGTRLPIDDAQLAAFDGSGNAATYTFPLIPNSPAFAAIPNAACSDAFALPVQDDQRGKIRGVGLFGANPVLAPCSIGAYEGTLDMLFSNGFEAP